MKKLIIIIFLLFPYASNAIFVYPQHSLTLGEEKVIDLNNSLSYPLRNYGFIGAAIPKTWWKIIGEKFVFTPRDIGYFSGKMYALDQNGNIESQIIEFAVNPKEKVKIILPEKKIVEKKEKKVNISKRFYYLRKGFQKSIFYQNLNFHYYQQRLEHEISIDNPNKGVRLICMSGASLKKDGIFYNGSLSQSSFTHINDQGSIKPTNTKILVKFQDNIPEIKGCFIEIDKKFENQGLRILKETYGKNIGKYSNEKFRITINSLPITLAITKEDQINEPKILIQNLRMKIAKQVSEANNQTQYYALLANAGVFKNTEIDPNSIVNRGDGAQAIVNYFDKSHYKTLIKSRLRNDKKYFSNSKIFKSEAQEILAHLQWLSENQYFIPDITLYKGDLANIFLNIDRSNIPKNKRSQRIDAMIDKGYLEKEIDYFDNLKGNDFAKMIFNFKEVINSDKYSNLTEISNPQIVKAIEERILGQSDIDEIKHNGLSIGVFLKTLSNTLNLEFEANSIISIYLKNDYKYVVWKDVDIENQYSKYFALAYEKGWILNEKNTKINPENKISRFSAAQIIVRAIGKTNDSYNLYKNLNKNLEIVNSFSDIDEKKEENRFIVFLKKNDIFGDFVSSLGNSANLFVGDRNVDTYSLISWMWKLRDYMNTEIIKEDE